jgi:hypothetical protein
LAKQLHLFDEPYSPYFKYQPVVGLESYNCKLYRDRALLTDKTLHFNRTYITLVDKTKKEAALIDNEIEVIYN